jgi:hypothetical protein
VACESVPNGGIDGHRFVGERGLHCAVLRATAHITGHNQRNQNLGKILLYYHRFSGAKERKKRKKESPCRLDLQDLHLILERDVGFAFAGLRGAPLFGGAAHTQHQMRVVYAPFARANAHVESGSMAKPVADVLRFRVRVVPELRAAVSVQSRAGKV